MAQKFRCCLITQRENSACVISNKTGESYIFHSYFRVLMDFRIECISPKKLAGKHLSMSFADNKTPLLWKSFMQEKNHIKHIKGNSLYSLQFYSPGHFEAFDPLRTFEKWAAVEVESFDDLPPGMEELILPSGMYAVFVYKGLPQNGGPFFRQIYGTCIPKSEYRLDDRPHFELLGEKYKNNEEDSEEEVWIPVKKKIRDLFS